ncbi:MAG: DnaJ domain-containing protein [Oscillospiraceae bacterium]
MKNPYEILGIPDDASNEEIKKAYKQLAKKYHPTNFDNNPVSDVAQSKMKELNDAYDFILAQKMNRENSSYTQQDTENTESPLYGVQTQYPDVRMHIDNDRLDDAITILDGIPVEVRTAEWFYLKGVIHKKRGWLEEAYNNFKIANDMDPYNDDYKNAVDEIAGSQKARSDYYGYDRGNNRRSARSSMGNGCGPCDVCMGLFCLDSCCDCCDGDACCCC